jgi:Domain of unknown function (DUF5076)
MKPLAPPDDAIDHKEAIELIRGWVVGGDLQVTIAFESFGNEVEIWGQLLAETVTHIADALSGEGYGDKKALYARLRSSLLSHLDNPDPGLRGTTVPPVQ